MVRHHARKQLQLHVHRPLLPRVVQSGEPLHVRPVQRAEQSLGPLQPAHRLPLRVGAVEPRAAPRHGGRGEVHVLQQHRRPHRVEQQQREVVAHRDVPRVHEREGGLRLLEETERVVHLRGGAVERRRAADKHGGGALVEDSLALGVKQHAHQEATPVRLGQCDGMTVLREDVHLVVVAGGLDSVPVREEARRRLALLELAHALLLLAQELDLLRRAQDEHRRGAIADGEVGERGGERGGHFDAPASHDQRVNRGGVQVGARTQVRHELFECRIGAHAHVPFPTLHKLDVHLRRIAPRHVASARNLPTMALEAVCPLHICLRLCARHPSSS
mmetsp:Transcript_29360/g.71306  ORF Transcript_29360/g.71306 Transcript_29360/m.71306 type:complete len:331 (-) Transcript_29360:8-1000(-)